MKSKLCMRNKFFSFGVIVFLLLFIIACGSSSTYVTPVGVVDETPVVEKNVMLKMSDGIKLATNLYFPAKNGTKVDEKFPVILQRTPYDKAASGNVSQAQYFAKHGYIVALQDTRGRYASRNEGLWMGYDDGNQSRDGYDTIEWLGTQGWFTGKVVMYGHSYPAVMIYAAAAENPPHFTGAIVSAAHSDYAAKGLRNNGAFEMRFFNYAFMMAKDGNRYLDGHPEIDAALEKAYKKENMWALLDKWPIKRGETPLALTPEYEDYYFLVATSGDWPGPNAFWTYPGHNIEIYYSRMSDKPMVHITGWYDTYARSEGEVYEKLSQIKKTPQFLVYGPRIHTTAWNQTYAGDVEFGPAANENFNEFCLSYFDQWTKGIDTGINKKPPVKLFIMGGGSGTKNKEGRLDVGGYWSWENEYPLARTVNTPFYLHADGSLSTEAPSASDAGKQRSYDYDPNAPVPSIGGNISGFGTVLVAGGFNQVENFKIYVKGGRHGGQRLAKRPDVLVFETPVLTKDIVLTGRIEVKLFASSSAVDTDFTAKLVDVYPANKDYPNGYELNLADGIVRARYREGRMDGSMTAKMMAPGQVYEFTIEPYDVGNIFKAGHKIQVQISSRQLPTLRLQP